MKQEFVSVYDLAAEMWSRPFLVPTLGMAIRSFSDECNRADETNAYWKHPEDYNLFHIGSFDDELGVIMHSDHRLLVRGVEVKAKAYRDLKESSSAN